MSCDCFTWNLQEKNENLWNQQYFTNHYLWWIALNGLNTTHGLCAYLQPNKIRHLLINNSNSIDMNKEKRDEVMSNQPKTTTNLKWKTKREKSRKVTKN